MNATIAIRNRFTLGAGAASLALAAFALTGTGTARADGAEWFVTESLSAGVEDGMNAGVQAAGTNSRTFSFTLDLVVEHPAEGSPQPVPSAAKPQPTCYLTYTLGR